MFGINLSSVKTANVMLIVIVLVVVVLAVSAYNNKQINLKGKTATA